MEDHGGGITKAREKKGEVLSFSITWTSSDIAVLGLCVRSMTLRNLL